jgi:hypothetical protein
VLLHWNEKALTVGWLDTIIRVFKTRKTVLKRLMLP